MNITAAAGASTARINVGASGINNTGVTGAGAFTGQTLYQADTLSANVTQQLDALSVGGLSTTLLVTANNGYTLEFTGATTLTHTAAADETINVAAGTLKLNGVAESGVGAKGLIKTGIGTLILDDVCAPASLYPPPSSAEGTSSNIPAQVPMC